MSAYQYFGAFFEALANRGVRHVVCSPGSRSAPLVLSAHAEPRLSCWVQLDERAGAFFALGLAKSGGNCVALICTSGSAAANYLPAVTESFYDGVPLILLTADRPPELRDRGAGQTINQIGLYGTHVRWSADLPVPTEVDTDHARFTAHRAVTAALGSPSGPVHLNVPLREPLEPPSSWRHPGDGGGAGDDQPQARPTGPGADPTEVSELAHLVLSQPRGLLAVGPSDLGTADAVAVKRLAALAGWPLIADAASGLRTGPTEDATIVATGHHLATSPGFWEAHRPEVIVRSGHPTAGRALREGLTTWQSETWLVDPLNRWEEPTTVPVGRWRSSIAALAREVLAELGSFERFNNAWTASWRQSDQTAQQAIDSLLTSGPLLEAGVARTLGEVLEPPSTLYVSNSMPVRDLDAFLVPRWRAPRVVAHRGTNGIDGVVSAAAGLAAAAGGRVVLLAGDLALLHDIGGLVGAVRLDLDLTIVVPNNDGGGIFSFLPVASAVPPAVFEKFFGTPHRVELASALTGLGVRHQRITDVATLREALTSSDTTGGVSVLEIPVDCQANIAQHRLIEQTVRAAIDGD